MVRGRLRVGLDANILIAGVLFPRWPHEVMKASLQGHFDLVLPEQVVAEARRHLEHPIQVAALEFFLAQSAYEELATPTLENVQRHTTLVRSEKDVPIALALLAGRADVFVTNDRDFTDKTATAENFQQEVRIMLPAVFLRDVIGWPSEALEAIRNRNWKDIDL